MATKRAKTFNSTEFTRFMKFIQDNSPMPERDRLVAALSFQAGLRIGEIALMKISAMLTVSGTISKTIQVFSDTTKGKKRERSVPLNAIVRECLIAFRKVYPNAEIVAISSQPFRWLLARNEPIPLTATFKPVSPAVLKNHYLSLLKAAGFKGASTHSGRRTFGTLLAQRANLHHCSLKDVQKLMGHSRLETTENYIDLSDDHNSLVGSLAHDVVGQLYA